MCTLFYEIQYYWWWCSMIDLCRLQEKTNEQQKLFRKLDWNDFSFYIFIHVVFFFLWQSNLLLMHNKQIDYDSEREKWNEIVKLKYSIFDIKKKIKCHRKSTVSITFIICHFDKITCDVLMLINMIYTHECLHTFNFIFFLFFVFVE